MLSQKCLSWEIEMIKNIWSACSQTLILWDVQSETLTFGTEKNLQEIYCAVYFSALEENKWHNVKLNERWLNIEAVIWSVTLFTYNDGTGCWSDFRINAASLSLVFVLL